MNWLDPEFLDAIATILGTIGLIPVSLFIYYYGTEPAPGHKFLRRYTNKWKQFMPGRLLMYMMITWELFIIFVIYRYFHLDVLPFEYLRIGVYAVLITIFSFMFAALRIAQKSDGEDPSQPGKVDQ